MTDKQNPPGRAIADAGPQTTYTGPQGTPRQPKPIRQTKGPDEISGTDVIVSDATKIPREGMTITAEGCAMAIAFCVKNSVGKDMSISEAARRLSIHRHTLTQILKRFEAGQVGAINIHENVSFEEFENMIADDLIASYFKRQDMLEAVDGELHRRITDTPEDLSVKDLINLKKLENQITINTATFLTDKNERDNKPKTDDGPLTDNALSELKEIFSTARKRIDDVQDKSLIIDNEQPL